MHKAACIIVLASFDAANLKDATAEESTMSLDKKSVEHLTRLARLEVADSVFDETVEKLSKVVEFVDQLSKVDTDGVVPMAHPTNAAQRLRPDAVTEANARDDIQKNAESVENGLYLVPKVIE